MLRLISRFWLRFRFRAKLHYGDGVMFQAGGFCQVPGEDCNLLAVILVTLDQPECKIRHEIITRTDLHAQAPTCVAVCNDRPIRLDWPLWLIYLCMVCQRQESGS
jgi:hypothetical protein